MRGLEIEVGGMADRYIKRCVTECVAAEQMEMGLCVVGVRTRWVSMGNTEPSGVAAADVSAGQGTRLRIASTAGQGRVADRTSYVWQDGERRGSHGRFLGCHPGAALNAVAMPTETKGKSRCGATTHHQDSTRANQRKSGNSLRSVPDPGLGSHLQCRNARDVAPSRVAHMLDWERRGAA